jgi:hypothetical protein
VQLLAAAGIAAQLHVTHPDKAGVYAPVANNVRQEQVAVRMQRGGSKRQQHHVHAGSTAAPPP